MVEIIRSKTANKPGPRNVYEFGLEFYRDRDAEVHEFKAYPALDAGSLNYTLSANRKPERAIEGMVRTIRKMLADDDGTPLGYKPTVYRPPVDVQAVANAVAHAVAEVDNEDGPAPDHEEHEPVSDFEEVEVDELDPDTLFVGPDEQPHDREFIAKAMAFEAGSSRRRFAHLMDVDEELTLHADQLQKVYGLLVGKAADRPTRR